MQPTPCPAALEALNQRLIAILMALRPLVAHHFLRHSWVPSAVTVPLCNRIGRYADRLARLITLFATGSLPRPRPPRPQPAHSHPAARTRAPHPPIPRRHGWMLAAIGWPVACYRNRLETLLAEPATTEFLAAAPGAGRLLRPVCDMLGLRPACLARPRRPRPQPEPRPVPANPPPAAIPRPRAATLPEPHPAPAFVPRPVQPLCLRLRNRWPFSHLPETRFA